MRPRPVFLTILAVGVLVAPLATTAQPAEKVRRIGFLGMNSATGLRLLEPFRQRLRELGWVEGRNIAIDLRFAEGRVDRLAGLAAELVQLKVDVMVAGPTPPAVAAKNATGTIPIVLVAVGDPVRLGLIASLARPGGNVTGLSFDVGLETFGKGLELLKETVPAVRRVAVLTNPTNPAQAIAIRDVKVAAAALGLQPQLLETRGPGEFDGAFAAMARERAGALLLLTESLFFLHRARLADLAVRNRLPSMSGLREYVEAGGLMSYGPSLVASYRSAALFVDKILKGARPADLPVEQPTTFELVVNLKTAKALGLTIPPSILARADEVIE
jgi:putative ABC transport system substrate-binding protein